MTNIRLATPDDVAALSLIGEKFFIESGWVKNLTLSKENVYGSFLAMIEDPDYFVIVAYTDDGELGGFMVVGLGNPWTVEKVAIEELFYVSPFEAGRGVAKIMLDYSEQLCKNEGAKLFYSSSTATIDETGRAARGFNILLRRNGWAEIPHARFFVKDL